MIKLPINVRKMTDTFKEVKEKAGGEVRMVILGRGNVGKSLIGAWLLFQNPALSRETLKSISLVNVDSKQGNIVNALTEAVGASLALYVIDASSDSYKKDHLLFKGLQRLDIPILVVLNKADLVKDGHDLRQKVAQFFAIPIGHVAIVSAKSGEGILNELAPKIVDLHKGSDLALAKKFPALREAVAQKIIRKTAYQNGFIGAMVFLPGADTPILTLNQVRMVMELASLYGENIGFERAKEILVILGSGLLFRTLARNVVSFVPLLGWGVKGGIAYSGTVAIGKAAVKYFGTREKSKK